MSTVKPPESPLTPEQKRFLLEIAREAIHNAVRGVPTPKREITDPGLLEKRGVFVTIYHGAELRGCLGEFESDEPLWCAVADRARASATQDPRFLPVAPEELDRISISISALTPLRRVDSPEEIEVGRHGIFLCKGIHRGTLLPQVAVEHGWNRTQFLEQTCRKARLPRDAWKSDCDLYVYGADVFGDSIDRL